MNIPKWVSPYLDHVGIQKISKCVENAEENTNAEIVPMIVKSSSQHHYVGPFLFLTLMLVFEHLLLSFLDLWTKHNAFLVMSILFVLSLLGAFFGKDILFIQRLFLTKIDKKYHVHQRAELEFYRSPIKKTHQHTGVLIFVSLVERQALILADKKISDQVEQDVWKNIVDEMILSLRKNDFVGAFDLSISKVGEILKQKCPAESHGINEVANELVILE